MTTKEMALAVLDHIEQMESERAALAGYASTTRDPLGRQPDWKVIASDRKVRETVQSRFADIRRSIALATPDDSAALVLLKGLIEEM